MLTKALTFLLHFLDKMKDAVIAKLANQAADFYGDAFKQCQYKDTLPKVCEENTLHMTQETQMVSNT